MSHPNGFVELTIVALQVKESVDNDGFALDFFPVAILLLKLDRQFEVNHNDLVVVPNLHFGESRHVFLVSAEVRVVFGGLLHRDRSFFLGQFLLKAFLIHHVGWTS